MRHILSRRGFLAQAAKATAVAAVPAAVVAPTVVAAITASENPALLDAGNALLAACADYTDLYAAKMTVRARFESIAPAMPPELITNPTNAEHALFSYAIERVRDCEDILIWPEPDSYRRPNGDTVVTKHTPPGHYINGDTLRAMIERGERDRPTRRSKLGKRVHGILAAWDKYRAGYEAAKITVDLSGAVERLYYADRAIDRAASALYPVAANSMAGATLKAAGLAAIIGLPLDRASSNAMNVSNGALDYRAAWIVPGLARDLLAVSSLPVT